jgi:hypothetical protein
MTPGRVRPVTDDVQRPGLGVRAVGEIEAEADVVEQRVAGVRSRVHDGDPEPSAGERFRNAMESHLELPPAIAEVLREAGDGLLDGAEVDDIHVAIGQFRLGEKLVPVAVRRAHETASARVGPAM